MHCDKLELAMVARNLVATCPKPNDFLAIGIYNTFVNFSKIDPILFSETC